MVSVSSPFSLGLKNERKINKCMCHNVLPYGHFKKIRITSQISSGMNPVNSSISPQVLASSSISSLSLSYRLTHLLYKLMDSMISHNLLKRVVSYSFIMLNLFCKENKQEKKYFKKTLQGHCKHFVRTLWTYLYLFCVLIIIISFLGCSRDILCWHIWWWWWWWW